MDDATVVRAVQCRGVRKINYPDEELTGIILYRTPPTSLYIEEIGKFYHYAVGAVMTTPGEISLEHLR